MGGQVRTRAAAAAGGVNEATIYTHAFGSTARTSGLLRCLRSSGVARAGWPG